MLMSEKLQTANSAPTGGTNPALRTFYYRLLRLIALCIHPIFVFDGPNKPPFKRNKRTGGPGASVASIPEFLAKQLLKQFGFPVHLAPGEAEAECALLQREGIVDAVLSEDVDTLMFGSGLTIRNWSPEHKSGKTPTHVNVYDATETKNGPSGLDREGMILVALMSGGDYIPEGIPGCGPKKACEAARAGFGRDLCRLGTKDAKGLQQWRERLQHEIKTNESKFFAQKRPSLVIPNDFPRTDILAYYTHPAVSNHAGLDKLKASIKWDQQLDFPGLRSFTHDAFDWVKLEGAKHFIRSLAPSLLVRHLRMRAEHIENSPSEDLEAVQKDEAFLVKGIHGKRQHAVTDGSTELRVSFTPIELVKIDLGIEEPDDEVENPPGTQADIDDELPLDIDDDAEATKKRGPTKFDPYQPARAWVLETYVKVGVPLKVQDWEAERLRPLRSKRTASATDTSTRVPRPRGGGRTKMVEKAQQTSIQSFAKVRKPSTRDARQSSKTRDGMASYPATSTVVSLLSSSPIRTKESNPVRAVRESSLSPLPELPRSVTKRHPRPMQRAHSLHSNLAAHLNEPESPTSAVIQTLNLVDSSPVMLLSKAGANKHKMQGAKEPPTARAIRAVPNSDSPTKKRQTTLNAWTSPGNSPAKPRMKTPPADLGPITRPPRFQVADTDVETLDLTFSSPLNFHTEFAREPKEPRQHLNRPPLANLSSTTLNTADASTSKPTDTLLQARAQCEPSTHKDTSRPSRMQSTSPEIESLDLTGLASPSLVNTTASPPLSESAFTLRRSPRAHITAPIDPRIRNKSPPAAWKAQSKKKREVILRKSLAGAWTFADAESPTKAGNDKEKVLKGKERKRWRESEIEVLDLC